MSQKISQLPAVIAANIQDTDVMPLVATNITSKVTVANLRTKLGTQPPLGGRSVTDAFTYLTNNAVFNVKDYGAFGDGVTDDTVKIQAAITALTSAGSGQLYFPVGTFLISATLVLPSNCRVKNEGIIKAKNSANIGNMLSAVSQSGVSVEGGEIDANAANNGANYAIVFTTGSRNRVFNVYIHDTLQAGIQFNDEWNSKIILVDLVSCGRVGGTDNHGIMVVSTTARGLKHILISECYVDTAYRKGITTYSATPGFVQDVKIISCTAINCGLGGIYVSNAAATANQIGVIVEACITRNNYTNILFSFASGAVLGCTSYASSGDVGIDITDVSNVSVKGNIIDFSYTKGMAVRGTASSIVIVEGNIITRSNRSVAGFAPGLWILNTTLSIFRSNSISDVNTQQTYAIYEDAGSDNNIIDGNYMAQASASLIVITGASTLAQGSSARRQGINTTAPLSTLDVAGRLRLRSQAWTIVNGANNNVALPATPATTLIVTGPTAVFNISGILALNDGDEITILNYTSFAMTLNHNSVNSSAGNKFLIGGSADIVVASFGSARLTYSSTAGAWIVSGGSRA